MGCKRLATTPFPFPYAQLLLILLILHLGVAPVVIVQYTTNQTLAIVLCFFCILAYFAFYEVARELENPFFYDPNDIDLSLLQQEFNMRLLSLLRCQMKPQARVQVGQ